MLPLTPTRLGRYEIVDEIGKGAMGVVYLARDPLIGRLVALKTFRIGYSVKDQEMEQFRIRFMREAQSAGILTHPNIVTIHDVVEQSEEGLAFIAMEYVRGTNLKLMLQGERPLTMQFVLDIVAQVGEALDYAHSNRVIHRDVKPANILITTENRVKITDFGIARLDSSNLTQEGQLLGTPNYMAPEQIQGKDVDYRTDLFSLGVVLYEMLTRHKPFQGENLTVVSHRIVYDHFTPLREYIQDLPPGIDRILAKALEKDPARRYQRAREMVDALRRLVESSASRDDLNETQSLSSTLVLPPPAVPSPPKPAKLALFSRWRKQAAPPPPPPLPATDPGSQASSAAVPLPVSPAATGVPPSRPPLPPLPAASGEVPLPPVTAAPEDTVATQAPVAPMPPKAPPGSGRLSPRQLAVGVGVAASLAVLLGAAVLLWRSWSQPASPVTPQTSAAEDARQTQLAQLLAEGHAALRRADYDRGIALYRQAEQLDPGNQQLRNLREMAEVQAQDFPALKAQEQDIADKLKRARQALKNRQFDSAASLAGAVLWLDERNEEARGIRAEAQKGQAAARQAKQRPGATQPHPTSPGQETASTPSPATQPAGSTPAEADAKASSLRIHFQSDMDATVIVRVDGREVVRQTFERGGSLFRPRKNEAGHDVTLTREIPAGSWRVLVYVTPKKRAAEIQTLDGNFPSGGSRTLEIYLSASAQLKAQLI
jgi:serine/threonine protein kinase